jgi:hypothetical protein
VRRSDRERSELDLKAASVQLGSHHTRRVAGAFPRKTVVAVQKVLASGGVRPRRGTRSARHPHGVKPRGLWHPASTGSGQDVRPVRMTGQDDLVAGFPARLMRSVNWPFASVTEMCTGSPVWTMTAPKGTVEWSMSRSLVASALIVFFDGQGTVAEPAPAGLPVAAEGVAIPWQNRQYSGNEPAAGSIAAGGREGISGRR